jgi:hypothetical protein
MADQMPFLITAARGIGKLLLELLYAVFTKDTDARFGCLVDAPPIHGLGHGHQGYRLGIPADARSRRCDPLPDLTNVLAYRRGRHCHGASLWQEPSRKTYSSKPILPSYEVRAARSFPLRFRWEILKDSFGLERKIKAFSASA